MLEYFLVVIFYIFCIFLITFLYFQRNSILIIIYSCSYVRAYKHIYVFPCDVSFPANIGFCKALHESLCGNRAQNTQTWLEHRSTEHCHWVDQTSGKIQVVISSFDLNCFCPLWLFLLQYSSGSFIYLYFYSILYIYTQTHSYIYVYI